MSLTLSSMPYHSGCEIAPEDAGCVFDVPCEYYCEECDWCPCFETKYPSVILLAPGALSRPLDFPAEIIYMIIEAADDNPDWPTYDSALDVHRFLFINHKWRVQAERYLYTYIHVLDSKILLFCRTLFKRPDLAKYVKEIHFTGGLKEEVSDGDLDTIVRGLMMLENLRDLSMWAEAGFSGFNKIMPLTCTFILRNPFPFKLFRFCTDLVWSEDLRDFLILQPEIRILYLTMAHPSDTSYELPPTALPNLRCFYSFPGILSNFARLPAITHAHIVFDDHNASEEALGAREMSALGPSLKVAAFSRECFPRPDLEYLTPRALLRTVAGSCVNLVILCIYDCSQVWSPRDHDGVLQVVPKNFPCLRLFIWGSLHEPHTVKDWDIEEYEGFNTEPDDDDDAMGKLQLYAWELLTRHCTGTLEVIITSGFGRTPPSSVFIKDPSGGLPFLGRRPFADREDIFSFEFHDPDAPMEYIIGGYTNPDRFDRTAGWKPEYTHFLRHTILHPTASSADLNDDPVALIIPPQERTWTKIETANYHSDDEQFFRFEERHD